MTPPAANPARHDRLTLLLLVATLVMMMVTGWVVWRILTDHPADVLDNEVPQTVGNRLPNVASGVPSATVDDTIDVTATKCNRSDRPVTVTGVLYWQTVDPAGTTVTAGGGQATRPEGCVTRSYENPVPDEVRAHTRKLVKEGREWVEWQIIGHEDVVGDTAANPAVWWTQPFRLYMVPPARSDL